MDRIILITGTRKGVGAALAEHYLSQGDIVVGCSRKMPDWTEGKDRYCHFLADVADEAAVTSMFRAVAKEYGRLDALINNAGVASMNHSLLTPIKAVQRVLATNTVGTFLLCREAAKLMRKNHYGRIVNFSTVAVPLKLAGEAAYAASKAAIVSLTQTLAREYVDFGVTVNAVGPTPIKTDLIRGVTPEKLEHLIAQQAIHRYGTYEDVENIIDFFLRKESSFITGQVIYLGGV